MRLETRRRKKAMAGFRQMTDEDQARESLYRIMSQGKRALDAAFLDSFFFTLYEPLPL